MLVDALPGESATKTAIRDAIPDDQLAELAKQTPVGHGAWSHTDTLLGVLITHARWLIYATYAAQGGKPKEPEPFPMPGVAPKRRRALSAEGRAYLERLRDEHARTHSYDSEAEGA